MQMSPLITIAVNVPFFKSSINQLIIVLMLVEIFVFIDCITALEAVIEINGK